MYFYEEIQNIRDKSLLITENYSVCLFWGECNFPLSLKVEGNQIVVNN